MVRIEYTKTYFKEPEQIDLDTYNYLLGALTLNRNFNISPKSETFIKHFKVHFIIIISSLGFQIIGGILVDNVYKDIPEFLDYTLAFAFLAFLVTILLLLSEGPSYLKFLRKKKKYFSKMKYAIKNTNSYEEFIALFYNIN
jgi:hypothetical protein